MYVYIYIYIFIYTKDNNYMITWITATTIV